MLQHLEPRETFQYLWLNYLVCTRLMMIEGKKMAVYTAVFGHFSGPNGSLSEFKCGLKSYWTRLRADG